LAVPLASGPLTLYTFACNLRVRPPYVERLQRFAVSRRGHFCDRGRQIETHILVKPVRTHHKLAASPGPLSPKTNPLLAQWSEPRVGFERPRLAFLNQPRCCAPV